MSSIEALQERYERLDRRFETRSESAIDADCLMAFDYDYAGRDAEVAIDTEEFTAVCPWSGLPDFGKRIQRFPRGRCRTRRRGSHRGPLLR